MKGFKIGDQELLREGKKIANKIIEILYPSTCPICMKVLEKSKIKRIYVCDKCKNNLTYIESPRCLKCGKPIEYNEEEYCYDCTKVDHIYSQGLGVWAYTNEIKNSIYQFKYHNKREYASFYGMEIVNQYKTIIQSWNPDVLIPVPLHKSKYKKRGYNQAEIIAKSLGEILEIPVDNQILLRNKKTLAQKELNDKERLKNLENAFIINKNNVNYKTVILIDDIYTTGTTIDACAKVLISSGVMKVYYISLCIGKGF